MPIDLSICSSEYRGFFFFLNQVRNNGLKQKLNRRSTGSHVYNDWWGDAVDWATFGMFDWKNQTQMQQVNW